MSDDPSASEDPTGADDLPELLADPEEQDAEASAEGSAAASTPMLPDPGSPAI
ncbi:MAG: hypothetical protein M3N68_11385 [Actinomycetota bacterium]|nr:hypothetical protein [Actinomycetota bacterium]